ncbi:hypothetical protein TIFTF001_001356 [Ficus carica]|uniref:non-specific serine/threonine protein kinase n=1 Tax=Ficus carica TaxID=3494 RepID=A0AA87YZI6_FICCA|nr:hypothetical protein TIFTF001_001356 [Ficus carica]
MALSLGVVLVPLFLLLPTSSLAQTNDSNIIVGASLSAEAENSSSSSSSSSSSWLSPSGDFAFGFRQLENQHQSVPKGSEINLTADRGLVLTSPQGEELWKSETILGDVAYAVMHDEGGTLSSRQSETNYSIGRFQLRLNTINLPNDHANEPYYQTTGIQLVFNESGHMYVVREDGEKFNLTKEKLVSAKDYYLGATLSFDGVFTQYFHPKSFTADNVSWSSLGTIPENICFSMSVKLGVGVCGYNSICFLREDKRPWCECPRGVDDSSPTVAFIKLRKNNFSTLPQSKDNSSTFSQSPALVVKKKDKDGLILAGSIMLGSSVSINFLLVGVLCLRFFSIYKGKHEEFPKEVSDMKLRRFTYKELEEATDGFSEELGKGTFGTVYKGKLQQSFVAVKKLRWVVQDGEREFKTEVKAIGHKHHRNLVRLLVYCEEQRHRLLVYEFMSNRTLAAFLFGDSKPSWKQRIEIALGIARGLLYLHEECNTQIIHCDIKPQNILLDESTTTPKY